LPTKLNSSCAIILNNVYSNAPLDPAFNLHSPATSQANTILDLGADEFTVGRLHTPMLDNELRLRRLRQEADDPEVALILLDVVLGYGRILIPPPIWLRQLQMQLSTHERQAGRLRY